MCFAKAIFQRHSISNPAQLFKNAFVQNKPEQLLKFIHLLGLFFFVHLNLKAAFGG